MRIALLNIEPKIFNSALMKISHYHKHVKDNEVEWYDPTHEYDMGYGSILFKFTDYSWVEKLKFPILLGGPGYDLDKRLSPEIEKQPLDYSIYPDCDYSMVWFSRGCIRACPFCIVRRKEGYIHESVEGNLNPNGKSIHIMDNNFFANPYWRDYIPYIKELNQKINFEAGIDLRIFDEEQGEALKTLKLGRTLHVAWDNPRDNLVPKLQLLTQYVPRWKIQCYVLIGYWSTHEEDLYRINKLRELKIDPYVMPYDKKDQRQRDLTRWIDSRKYRGVSFEEYLKIKSIKKYAVLHTSDNIVV